MLSLPSYQRLAASNPQGLIDLLVPDRHESKELSNQLEKSSYNERSFNAAAANSSSIYHPFNHKKSLLKSVVNPDQSSKYLLANASRYFCKKSFLSEDAANKVSLEVRREVASNNSGSSVIEAKWDRNYENYIETK